MKKEIFFIALLLIIFFGKNSYAQTTPFRVFVYSQYPNPVYVQIFQMPFSYTNIPIQTQLATYDSTRNKYIATFPNLSTSSSLYIFAFQSMDNTNIYSNRNDLSTFDTNADNGYSINQTPHVEVLIRPLLNGINYSITQDLEKNINVKVTDTSNSINFLRFDLNTLNISLGTHEKQATLDSACSQYYCGSANTTIDIKDPGTYPISINNGLSSLAYIPQALDLVEQSPTESVPLSNTSIKSLITTPTPIYISSPIYTQKEIPLVTSISPTALTKEPHKKEKVEYNFIQNILNSIAAYFSNLINNVVWEII